MKLYRKGKPLAVLPDGHPRRMADGKNAWRRMDTEQREAFVSWMLNNGLLFLPDEGHGWGYEVARKAAIQRGRETDG